MNRRITLLVPVLLLALLSACGKSPVEADAGAGDPAPANGERKVLYWKSSMDPTFVSKSPGKDGMGMDLVPVYEGEQEEGPSGRVRIDPATIQNIGVTTEVVGSKRLTRDIRTVGRVGYDETKVRRIAPKVGGWIEKQHVNFSGQVVQRGEPLLEIYSPELVATQEEYLVALRYRERLKESALPDAIAGGTDLVRAVEMRLHYWNVTERQIAALRERGEITRTMVVYAPFTGIIVERSIPEGGFIQPGQTVYAIADIATIWVYANIYEYEAPWLRLGQDAEITLAYQPGATYRGKVAYVYPYLDKKTRTIEVRVQFANTPTFDLKPDMWVNVALHGEVARDGLAVPIQAVIRSGRRDIVIVALDEGRFEPREIHLGAQTGDEYEVIKGLAAGDRVVTSAQFLINSESNLQSAVRKMIGVAVTPPAQGDEPMEGLRSVVPPEGAGVQDHSRHDQE